ncbi:MAG: heptosyltransferase [Acidobacteriota bacterium]|nr:heptosyltransferase [Acidobacteriota bacterium]
MVVRGTNWVGDAVMTVPALRELRRVLPHAHITLATRSWAEGLFADSDFLDDLLIYDRRPRDLRAVARQTREWRRRTFDLALLFQNAFEAALIASAARVPLRIGYATDGRSALLTHALPLPRWRDERHEVFYYLNLVAELERLLYGASDIVEREPQFALKISEARKTRAREFLSSKAVRMNRPLVALCPGSTNSRAKRWPAERYAALADRFIIEADAEVLLIGSPDEVEVSREVASRMQHQPVFLTGQTDLAQAINILSLADVLISNDTGPAHIAAALNRPTLVIFGPTDPRTTRPFSPLAEIIRRPPDCAPCMLRDCPIDHRCMTAISTDEVFARASAIMKVAAAEVQG